MNGPKVFIGSSSEGEDYAHGVKEVLEEKGEIVVRHWRDVMAEAQSRTVIEALADALDEYDFGIFILSKDDVLTIRGENTPAPRDNVILELGLFTGRLGRERTLIVSPADFDIRVATDLLGVNLGTYTADKNATSAVRTAARRTRDRILELGPRDHALRATAIDTPGGQNADQAPKAREMHARARPSAPGAGWIEAARNGLLVAVGDAGIEPGEWVASTQTGLAQVVEVLPPVAGSMMLVRLSVDGVNQPVFLSQDRLYLPRFSSDPTR